MIFYFSRTQKTKTAAEALHEITGAPLYALNADINNAKGIRFAWKAIRSVMSAKGSPVSNMPDTVPDEIYLCGPIWAGQPAGPLKYFVNNLDLKKTKVNMLLTAMQPTVQHRASALEMLAKAGCIAGAVYLLATSKQLPDKEVVAEHLREMMAETTP